MPKGSNGGPETIGPFDQTHPKKVVALVVIGAST